MKKQQILALVLSALPLVACDDPDLLPVRPSPVAAQVTLSGFPSAVLRSGSDVRVTARVTDASGAIVDGQAVTFTTTAGTLSQTSALTNSGMVTVTLSASEPGAVTASVPGASAVLEVGAVAPFSLRVTPGTEVPVGPVVMRIEVLPNRDVVSPPAPVAVTLDCGTGGGPQPANAGLGIRCVFPSQAVYTVEATARAANGWTATERVQLQAADAPTAPTGPLSLTVTASRVSGREFRISASTSVPVRELGFSFGDEAGATRRFDGAGGTFAAESHVYQPGIYTVRVTAESVDGRQPLVSQSVVVLVD